MSVIKVNSPCKWDTFNTPTHHSQTICKPTTKAGMLHAGTREAIQVITCTGMASVYTAASKHLDHVILIY